MGCHSQSTVVRGDSGHFYGLKMTVTSWIFWRKCRSDLLKVLSDPPSAAWYFFGAPSWNMYWNTNCRMKYWGTFDLCDFIFPIHHISEGILHFYLNSNDLKTLSSYLFTSQPQLDKLNPFIRGLWESPRHLNDVLLDTTLVSSIYVLIHINIQKGRNTLDFT